MQIDDYPQPISSEMNIVSIVNGLVSDLQALRDGNISVNDALARAMLAKQIFNGARIYLNATRLLASNAKVVRNLEQPGETVAQ